MDEFAILIGNEFGVRDTTAFSYWKRVNTFPEIIIISAFDNLLIQNKNNRLPTVNSLIGECATLLAEYRAKYKAENPPREKPEVRSQTAVGKQIIPIINKYYAGVLTNKEYADACIKVFEKFRVPYSVSGYQWFYNRPDGRVNKVKDEDWREEKRRKSP